MSKKKTFEGFGTFAEDGGFKFEPRSKQTLAFGGGSRWGKMVFCEDATAEFRPISAQVAMPPVLNDVLHEENLSVKRSSRNFIVTMKFPIIEGRNTTIKSHSAMWKRALAAVGDVREAIKLTIEN